jgi:two-component system nitrogen regulation sensor histidine kinase NtrY
MKLVFFYLGLVLLPAIVLFYGSAQVIKETVEALPRNPLEQRARAEEFLASWTGHFTQLALDRAHELAAEVAGAAREADHDELTRRLGRAAAQEGLAWVELSGSGVRPIEIGPVEGSRDRDSLRERLRSLAVQARDTGVPASGIERLQTGLAALAAVPVGDGSVLAVALELPAAIASAVKELDSAEGNFRLFRAQRKDLVRFYVTLIALMFIATLFVATWIGLYVARRISEPIRELAAAARGISAGNLDVRVSASVGDELGLLVDAFNEMAAQLEENREVITRSTAELRRSNKALDERRRYVETLVAHLSTAVFSLDPGGRVSTANPAVERILGVHLRVGDDPALLFAGRGLEPLAQLLIREGGEPVGLRRELELSQPAPRTHVSVRVSPLVGQGNANLGTLVMVEDLTDSLRAQKVLAWHEVARRIAHEIKNPLTPIQLAAQRLRKKFLAGSGDLDRVLLESTDTIEREVTGLKELVDEFSRFARMPQVAPSPVRFSDVVESVLALYRGLPGIDWEVELDPAVGLVHVDAQQIRRALINLIDNAIAAVGGKGRVRIATRGVAGGGMLRIEVEDSGPGIPVSDRERMFVPYFSTKKKGTGLGLAIVHKVVTDHRGTIRVEDGRPHGARFVIEIPA